MAPLKFSKLVSYSSEDPRFPASNLLGEGKWMCKDEREKQVWVLLQLVETSVITNIVDKLSKEVAKEKWDLVKVVLTQPFTKLTGYGLSFISLMGPSPAGTTLSNATASVAASLRDKETFHTSNPFTVFTSVQFTGLSSPSFEGI